MELLAASRLRANVNLVFPNHAPPQKWPVPSHQASLQMRPIFALEDRHCAQPMGVHRGALCPQEVLPSPPGGRPDLWLRTRTLLPEGRKQIVWGLPETKQADWLPLQREYHMQTCWGPRDPTVGQILPAVPCIPGPRGDCSPGEVFIGSKVELASLVVEEEVGNVAGSDPDKFLPPPSPDLPRPRAGGTGIEPAHPLHPQRGGLPLERATSPPTGEALVRVGTPLPLSGTNHSLSHQGHLNTCSFNVVPCPNRCPTKLSRRDLPAHLQHDCPKRRLKCEFCGCDFSGEAFEVGGAWLRVEEEWGT